MPAAVCDCFLCVCSCGAAPPGLPSASRPAELGPLDLAVPAPAPLAGDESLPQGPPRAPPAAFRLGLPLRADTPPVSLGHGTTSRRHSPAPEGRPERCAPDGPTLPPSTRRRSG